MVVGLGTGSTVYYAIHKIGELVKQGLEIKAIATSVGSEQIAQQLGINLVTFADIDKIDLTIDGADEVDPHWNLIKEAARARGSVAAASKELIVIADESKVVAQLGKFPLPIEVIPFGWEQTEKKIAELGCAPKLRVADGKPYLTDNGNYILDCSFGTIADPKSLHDRINQIVGVVDNGLFVGYASRVIVGYHNETVKELVRN